MAATAYMVLKPFKASVDHEIVMLEPGETIPGPRVPEIESWGRSITSLLHNHKIAPVQEAVGEDADDQTLLGELERRGVDLAARLLGKLDPEALLAHMEATVEPETVLGRFSEEALAAELERRGAAANHDQTQAPDAPEQTAGSPEPAPDAGGAAGTADAGEGGAGAEPVEPPPPADVPAEPKPDPEPKPEPKPAARKPAAKKPAAKQTKPRAKKG